MRYFLPPEKEMKEQDCGLSAVLTISKGAKVMLRKNLNVKEGLVNGAVGVVVDLLSSTGEPGLPEAVIVDFENYKGEPWDPAHPTWVPIRTHTFTSPNKKRVLERTQIPLCLRYAITVHKAQGQTYDQVIVNVGDAERQLGLTYVALSRVKTLQGLMIEAGPKGFTWARLEKINKHKDHAVRLHAELWLAAKRDEDDR